MLTMHKDLDRFHRQLRLNAFFSKDKVKKAEVRDAREAFMEFDYANKAGSGRSVVRTPSQPSLPENAQSLQSTPDLTFDINQDIDFNAYAKGFENRQFLLPSYWEPPIIPPVALEAFQMANELELSLMSTHSPAVQNISRDERQAIV